MTTLDDFLQATDLDDLLRAKHKLSPITADDASCIKSIISEWRNQQLVANLLFYPCVMPIDIRFTAIDRALRSSNTPYLTLAAVVGLQEIKPTDVPTKIREEWGQVLLEMIQSESEIFAGRTSVTMFSWFAESNAAEFLSLYPVIDETASKNILAFALSLFGDLPADEYTQCIRNCGVAPNVLAAFKDYHASYVAKISNGQVDAGFMKCPLLSYLPNLSEVSISVPTKPWWKFW
jgi:hypothetical protein